mgnify:CR=1 FL=1
MRSILKPLATAGSGVACGFVAALWLQDPSLGDETKAAPYAKRGCELNDAFACTWHGIITYNGIGVPADHAAGFRVVTEAGGRVTDVRGVPLDFGRGRGLSANQGVIVTNGAIHDRVVAAVGRVLGL